jgi:hypothetical protein
VSYIDADASNADGFPVVAGQVWPENEMATGPCTDNKGNFGDFPDACDGTDVDLGTDCYITGISVLEPPIAEIDPWPPGKVWYIGDGLGENDNPAFHDYATSGVCQRICKG